MITLMTPSSADFWPLLKLTAPNKVEYCLRHGLQLDMRRHKPEHGPTREREIYMMETLLHVNSEWLFFMGADTLITNLAFDVRQLLDPEYDLIIGEGRDLGHINNDVLLLRNTTASADFLRRIVETRADYSDSQVATWDIIERSLVPNFKAKLVPYRTFNSIPPETFWCREYCEWQRGDFVVHLTGLPFDTRVKLVEKYLPEIIR